MLTVQRLKYLCYEIYKTLNNLNPFYLESLLKLNECKMCKQEYYCIYKHPVGNVENLKFFHPWILNLELAAFFREIDKNSL